MRGFTECKNVCWLLVKPAIVLHQLSETIPDCCVIELESWILESGFPGTLEVLECRKCAIETWMFLSRKMMKNAVGILANA
jgi:hypothetical protein